MAEAPAAPLGVGGLGAAHALGCDGEGDDGLLMGNAQVVAKVLVGVREAAAFDRAVEVAETDGLGLAGSAWGVIRGGGLGREAPRLALARPIFVASFAASDAFEDNAT